MDSYPFSSQAVPSFILPLLNSTVNAVIDIKRSCKFKKSFYLIWMFARPCFNLFHNDFWLQKKRHAYLPAEEISRDEGVQLEPAGPTDNCRECAISTVSIGFPKPSCHHFAMKPNQCAPSLVCIQSPLTPN